MNGQAPSMGTDEKSGKTKNYEQTINTKNTKSSTTTAVALALRAKKPIWLQNKNPKVLCITFLKFC